MLSQSWAAIYASTSSRHVGKSAGYSAQPIGAVCSDHHHSPMHRLTAELLQVSADLLDKIEELSPEEITALQGQRKDLAAKEAALKQHLQHAATQLPSASAASSHQIPANTRASEIEAEAQCRGSVCDPWDSAGVQLRSAGDRTAQIPCGIQEHGAHTEAWCDGMAEHSHFGPDNGPDGGEYGQDRSTGACWGAQASGAWQGSAGG